jgi:very-short-patch-repair endonuclease
MRSIDLKASARAQELRKVDNDAEHLLWQELRGRRLNGRKFVRQFPIGPYFADFACREVKLVVELDGSQHADSGYDRARDRMMQECGWSVLRIWSADLFREPRAVIDTIFAAMEGRLESTVASDMRYVRGHEVAGKTAYLRPRRGPSSGPSDHLLPASGAKEGSKI